MNKNDAQDFTNACQAIWDATSKVLAPDILQILAHSRRVVPDKREQQGTRHALKFCFWGKEWRWDHEYANYNILFDPVNQTGECVMLMLRFFFFTNRVATGSGKYNSDVWRILGALNGKHDFLLERDEKKYKLQRGYSCTKMTPAWEKECADDLSWVLENSFRPLTQLAKR